MRDQFPLERKRHMCFRAMVYWLVANCLAGALLAARPQIEDTRWFWFFCIPGVLFLRAAYRWVHALGYSDPKSGRS
jgi:hypothetical protein